MNPQNDPEFITLHQLAHSSPIGWAQVEVDFAGIDALSVMAREDAYREVITFLEKTLDEVKVALQASSNPGLAQQIFESVATWYDLDNADMRHTMQSYGVNPDSVIDR